MTQSRQGGAAAMKEKPTGQPPPFSDPDFTLKGDPRAIVPFTAMKTFWVNTGTVCNIACKNCYIESSPKNDSLAYLTDTDLVPFLEELLDMAQDNTLPQIGFTGGEPFINPHMPKMMQDCMERGFHILVLTNAMRPMQLPRASKALLALQERFNSQMSFRVSLDHYSKQLHEEERGENSWDVALEGIDWLADNGFHVSLAGRTIFREDQQAARNGYAGLVKTQGWPIDVDDNAALMLFPEMKSKSGVPEISVKCWGLLGVQPEDQMCATSRMLVRRKGAKQATVLPCTLITQDTAFDMGSTLKQAMSRDDGMFKKGGIKLCHPFCAEFCVLGGGSCSV